jgi:probable rRNA maturation factor
MINIDPPSSIYLSALSTSGLTRFLNRARLAVGVRGEVEVLLTSDRAIRRLNRDFRGKDKATDVLSFPAPSEISGLHAGDLAISLETANRQAETYGHTLRDEVRVLLLHGLLHLSGADHETDDGDMAAREAVLRRELRLPSTLIERTEGSAKTAGKAPVKRLAAPRKVAAPVGSRRAVKSKRGRKV